MRESFTLYELQRIIGAAVEQFLPQPVWVSAEIAELKVNYSGHCYIELIEKVQSSTSGSKAKAQARAVIWKNQYPTLAEKFERATKQRLCATMKVLLQVVVSHHPVYGLSLQITDIDPTYTVGELEQQRQQTIERLQKEGVWDMNRQVAMPQVVQRVAVVSSATAAGYRDFIEEIAASAYDIKTTLFEAIMQGETSEQSIVNALTAIAQREEEFDAVAIIRGGGSTGDLECFNSYLTALYVAQFPLPVLTGIGHDKDVSIVDMVAAVPLKTPTAVATWICSSAERFDGQLESAVVLLKESCAKCTQSSEIKLQQLDKQLQSYARTALSRQRDKLDSYALLVENFTPERLLKLGFALVRAGNKVIGTTSAVEVGKNYTIELSDGYLKAKIIEKHDKKD
ncbi:MAG: exodeoxyribonuclease VII large subunit [Alistipes sp.]|nr:exodeoxyribonuclease VII large subunit [Alistipes sp.]